jgi:hypothetical protein
LFDCPTSLGRLCFWNASREDENGFTGSIQRRLPRSLRSGSAKGFGNF